MKKYGLLIGLVVLLLIAVYVNVRINKAQDNKAPATASSVSVKSTVSAGASEDYFATFREDRGNTNDKLLEVLESIINNKATGADQIAEAQEKKLALVDQMEQELSIESQLKAKGFADAAADVKEGSVTVVVKADSELTAKQVAQVCDVVTRETGVSVKNIKVMPSRAN